MKMRTAMLSAEIIQIIFPEVVLMFTLLAGWSHAVRSLFAHSWEFLPELHFVQVGALPFSLM